MDIRKLGADDAEAFRMVRLQALGEYPAYFSSSLEEESGVSAEDIRQRWARSNLDTQFVAGAFVEGELVGIIGFYRESKQKLRHKGQIWGMYVKPALQQGGIGWQLLQFALGEARRMPGLQQVHLTVVRSNTAAKRLYEKAGFCAYGVEQDALQVDGQWYDEELMALPL